MVKSKQSPCRVSVALRQLNHIHKKGPQSFKVELIVLDAVSIGLTIS